MESNYNNRDFEQFVKQSADQYRMYPSEKVWKGVHTALHGRRRLYYGFGLVLLLLTSGAVTWIMVTDDRQQTIVRPIAETHTATSAVNEPEKKPDILNPKTTKTTNKIIIPFAIANKIQDEFAGLDENFVSARNTSNEDLSEPVTSNIPITGNNDLSISNKQIAAGKSISIPLQQQIRTERKEVSVPESTIPVITSVILPAASENTVMQEEKKVEAKETYPFTIESVVNTYQRIGGKRLSWHVYFTPTISYRRLTENKDFLQANRNLNTAPGYLYIPDINSAVKHKPDMGFNLGVTAGYPVSKKLKLTAGFQFNISKYDIQASYVYQPEQATVALNTGYSGDNTVTTNTNYRNYLGYKENWLRNLYFSASIPIGADLVLKGTNQKPLFGVAATLQPIYILDNNAYLISTDYKNYVMMPSLINQWNLGTSVEVYAAYSTGTLNWKVGPQVRYQLGSSFQKKYPVKEHLFDFGLKVGVMLKN